MWLIVSGIILRIIYEFVAALCVAVDFVRWKIAMCAEHRIPWTLGKAARELWRRWVYFYLNEHEERWRGAHGWWNGYRDWGVNKSDDERPAGSKA